MRLQLIGMFLFAVSLACGAQSTEGSSVEPGTAAAVDAHPAGPSATGTPQAKVIDLDTVVVSGLQPGPGMWKVSKGDHVLYILAMVSPLPKRMEWQSADVEATIAQAQAVIEPPSVSFDADVGFFGKLTLLPSVLKARKNPDGRSLQQSVSPALYARWQVLKARYIGSDVGVEKWRPIFAAQELYESAIRKTGLSQKDIVQRVVESAAKRHGVPLVSTKVTFKVTDAKGALREFNTTTLADTDCFAKTMDRIEGDLDSMRARANAWAVGDIAALGSLSTENQYVACTQAMTSSALFQKRGLGNITTRLGAAWMAAAEKSLAENRVSFAALGVTTLLRDGGFLARLREKGYTVEEP